MALTTFPDIAIHEGSAPNDTAPRILRNDFGDGYSQRVGDGINPTLTGWSLVWTSLTAADKATIDTFLLARGGTEAFYWTPPYESTPRKYTCPKWKFVPRPASRYTGTAEFIEEADLDT